MGNLCCTPVPSGGRKDHRNVSDEELAVLPSSARPSGRLPSTVDTHSKLRKVRGTSPPPKKISSKLTVRGASLVAEKAAQKKYSSTSSAANRAHENAQMRTAYWVDSQKQAKKKDRVMSFPGKPEDTREHRRPHSTQALEVYPSKEKAPAGAEWI